MVKKTAKEKYAIMIWVYMTVIAITGVAAIILLLSERLEGVIAALLCIISFLLLIADKRKNYRGDKNAENR